MDDLILPDQQFQERHNLTIYNSTTEVWTPVLRPNEFVYNKVLVVCDYDDYVWDKARGRLLS